MWTFIHSRRGANAFATLAAIAAAFALVVLGLRVISVIRYGDILTTSGTEAVDQYAVWKVQNGHPLYEMPDRYPYAFTPYNFLFYICYAGAAQLLHLTGPGMVLLARLLTVGGAIAGAVAQYRLTLLLCQDTPGPRTRWLLFCFAVVIWLGQDFAGWYVITTRPDTWAAAFATFGLLLYLRAIQSNSARLFLIASLVFFLAWSFKQVMVWTLLGASVHALFIRRSLKDFMLFTAPCGVLMIACLATGGPVYRYNIITAQAIDPINMMSAVKQMAIVVATNSFACLFGLIAIGAWIATRRSGERAKEPKQDLMRGFSPLIVIFVIALIMGGIALGRRGSYRNHIVEAFAVCGAMSAVIAVRIFESAPDDSKAALPRVRLIGCLLLCATIAVGVLHLVVPGTRFGLLCFTRPIYEAQKVAFDRIAELPKPMWSSFETPMVPWIANENKYPTIPIVEDYYEVANSMGLIKDGGLAGMVANHSFNSLLLNTSYPLYDVALSHGYQVVGETSFPLGQKVKILVKADQATTRP